jgi:hypothetical protein
VDRYRWAKVFFFVQISIRSIIFFAQRRGQKESLSEKRQPARVVWGTFVAYFFEKETNFSTHKYLIMNQIGKNVLADAYTYAAYRQLVTSLLAEGKQTGPGVPDSADMLEYTRLNEQRMSRIEKTFKADEAAQHTLGSIGQPMTWLVLTEGWCGDAAQIVPILQHMAESQPNLELRLLLRDQHPDVMDAFLTNGGRAIPVVIFVEPSTGRVLGHWGPRPTEAQHLMSGFSAKMKAATTPEERTEHYEAAKTAIHTWYAHDKTVSTQREVATAALAAAHT